MPDHMLSWHPGEGVWAEIVNAMNTGGLNQVHGIAHF